MFNKNTKRNVLGAWHIRVEVPIVESRLLVRGVVRLCKMLNSWLAHDRLSVRSPRLTKCCKRHFCKPAPSYTSQYYRRAGMHP
jgi:hypothetical protein